MQVRELGLGVVEIVPKRFGDARGYFAETWQRQRFRDLGIDHDWVQDNQSLSPEPYVLRGLHFQRAPMPQAKLVRVLRGAIFDVVLDIRPGSADFGRWVSCELSAVAFNQLYVPEGFAHGFLTLEPDTEVLYKVSAPYAPECERAIAWNDPALAIAWPLREGQQPLLSVKDAAAARLHAMTSDLVF
jgi:dTDP-4-dehydrorhamnose 3,5-epimerase